MNGDTHNDDLALFARLREMWEAHDPVPDGLADRLVAAVAIDDLTRDWDLLDLVSGRELSATRSEVETPTLEFGDGDTSILVQVSVTESGRRRLDGWAGATVLAVRLSQGGREWSAEPTSAGRFAFDDIPPGTVQLRLVISDGDAQRDVRTPQFEV